MSDELTIFAKTVYAEARGESPKGQEWVAWVIKNRAAKNRSYWGGGSIKDVCLKENQFECWNKGDINIEDCDRHIYERIRRMCQEVMSAPLSKDPTGGCDHYNNPSKEGYPPWTNNVEHREKVGEHQFYRSYN